MGLVIHSNKPTIGDNFLLPRHIYKQNTIVVIDKKDLPAKLEKSVEKASKGNVIRLEKIEEPCLHAGDFFKLPSEINLEKAFGTGFIVPNLEEEFCPYYFVFRPERFSEKVEEYIRKLYKNYREKGLSHKRAFSKLLKTLGYSGHPEKRVILRILRK